MDSHRPNELSDTPRLAVRNHTPLHFASVSAQAPAMSAEADRAEKMKLVFIWKSIENASALYDG